MTGTLTFIMQICIQDTYRNVLYERLHIHVEKLLSLPNIVHTKYYTNKQNFFKL